MLPYAIVGSVRLAIKDLQEKGFTIYAADSGDEDRTLQEQKDLKDVTFADLSALIMGSEGRGIRKNLLFSADEKINITGQVSFDSLNVSVAAGIMLYQFSSQKSS